MKSWIVFAAALIALASCRKETRECPGAEEKIIDVNGFASVTAGGTFNLSIDKGHDFYIKASGCKTDLDELTLTVDNQQNLTIDFKKSRSDRYRVDLFIMMPQLAKINLGGAAKATIGGFNGQSSPISHVLSGTSSCSANGAAINAHVDLSGTATLSLNGYTENLYGSLSGASRLDSYTLTAHEVDLSTSGTAKAYVSPEASLYADASGASRIFYKGNPQIKFVQTSGDGKVIQE